MKKRIFYRVKPECESYSCIDKDTIEEAIEIANKRNMIQIDTTHSNDTEKFVWNGQNCKIYKVTEIIEPCNIVDRNNTRPDVYK